MTLVDKSLGDAGYYAMDAYAGFGKRLLVLIIDSCALLAAGTALWTAFYSVWVVAGFVTDPSGRFWLCFFGLVWGYLGPIKRSAFGTLAYAVLGLRIVSAKGGPPSLFAMTMRMLMWMFGPFNLVLDLLWLGADTESQSLRDCYLQTYVVSKPAKPIGRAPVHLARYTAMGFALAYPRVCRPKTDV